MAIRAHVDRATVNRAKSLIEQFRNHLFVKERVAWNVRAKHRLVTRPMFWQAMVSCLLTTQQRSGEGSPVYRFTGTRPFPLRWTALTRMPHRKEALVQGVLIRAGGIRRHEVLSIQIAENFSRLRSGLWQETLPGLRTLMPTRRQTDERLAADFIDDHFVGFGPKQARNLLQWLGLTRYEIPIDSRAVQWINSLRLGVRVDPTRLQDRVYYCHILDAVQHVCSVAKIYPTLLDAAGFASLEG